MKDEHESRLARGYERMLERLREAMGKGESTAGAKFQDALETAKRKSVELNELNRDEADRVGDYLRRDLEDAAQTLGESDQDLATWWRMDLQLVESWLWDAFTSVADKTRLEWLALERRGFSAEYHTGELTGPGALQCEQCGKIMHFNKPGHIPPCPACKGTGFIRPSNDNG